MAAGPVVHMGQLRQLLCLEVLAAGADRILLVPYLELLEIRLLQVHLRVTAEDLQVFRLAHLAVEVVVVARELLEGMAPAL
jgi:hypothetical protein